MAQVRTEQTQRFVSARATGNGTRKREREFYAHPDQIKALATGQAFVVNTELSPRVELTRVLHPKHLAPVVEGRRTPSPEGKSEINRLPQGRHLQGGRSPSPEGT